MAINVDTSKPLTDEQIKDLRTRLPENLVQHYIKQAQGGEVDEVDELEKKAATKAPAKGAKSDPDILT